MALLSLYSFSLMLQIDTLTADRCCTHFKVTLFECQNVSLCYTVVIIVSWYVGLHMGNSCVPPQSVKGFGMTDELLNLASRIFPHITSPAHVQRHVCVPIFSEGCLTTAYRLYNAD